MLKLATQPRSRRERDGWRATPGRSGNAPRCHYPQKAPPSAPRYACRDVFRMQRFWNTAFQMPRVWNEQSNLAGRRPLCFNGARTERRTEQRTAIQGHPLGGGGCFVFPGARTKQWPAAAAPNMPSPTAQSRTLSAAAARDAPPARTQLAEAASPATSRAAGAASLSTPGQAARAHRMRDGSVPTSINGRTEARGRTVVGAGTGESRPRMQSAATVCAPMDKMPHHRRV